MKKKRAYLVDLGNVCQDCRKQAAIVELRAGDGSRLGAYCRPCGERAVKAQ